MKKVLRTLLKLLDYAEETFIVLGLSFMSIMNFVNVVSRHCFTYSFSFTEELTVIVFVWITMFGVAAGYKRCAHLGMSYIVEKFSKRKQAVFMVFSMVCSLTMIVIMIKYGFDMVADQIMLNAKTPALKLPAAVQGLSIPVGGILIALRTLQAGIRDSVRLWRDGGAVQEGSAMQ